MYIAVAGNIGAGKTALTKMLAKHYGWASRLESVDYNPYLEDFYRDMARWSFNMQIYFLNQRIQSIAEIAQSGEYVIQDRTIFEDLCVFTPYLHEQGLMGDGDYHNCSELFTQMMSLVPMPDLIVYIRSSVPNLVEQIQKRGRNYESAIRIDYLQGLNDKYEQWIKGYQGKLIIVPGDDCKFATNPADFGWITTRIDAELFGLFPFEGL